MPIAIAGMHRSGTSMVARLLHLGGLNLGPPEQLLSAQPDNPEGFWEHPAFVALNDDMLTAVGAHWHRPPPYPLVGDADVWQPFRERAAALPDEIGLAEPWGWKDPRSSLTFPVWAAVWPDLRAMVCVRNPLEVAQSLQDRDGFSYLHGLRLWCDYYERLLDAVPLNRRIVTHYDAYFIDVGAETRRLWDAVGLPVDESRLLAATATVVPRLRHTQTSAAVLAELDLPPRVLEVYGRLCADAAFTPPPDPSAADRDRSPRALAQALRLEDRLERQAERIRELEMQLAERDGEIDYLDRFANEMREHLRMRRELELRLSARRHRVADRVANVLKVVRRPAAT